MPRPRKRCRCRRHDGDRVFKPRSIPMQDLSVVSLELPELETLRLCDGEGLQQAEAAAHMGVSRGTVQRLLERARHKVAVALVESHALVIEEETPHATLHPHRQRPGPGGPHQRTLR